MTIEYPFSLAQLAQILSALENERRNPNTKRNAIKAIERNAAQIGLTAEAPDAIARAIAYAVEQPDDVDVNEVVVRPTASTF
jgi:NADP-dependent 3-hydroxy acid dehydrogenase YdfG